jgi:hypothetical protein
VRIKEKRYLGKNDEQWEAFLQELPDAAPGWLVCVCHGRTYAISSVYERNGSQRRRHRRNGRR